MLSLLLYRFLFPFRFLFRFWFLFLFLFPFLFWIPDSGFPLFQTPSLRTLRLEWKGLVNALSISKKSFPGSSVCASHSWTLSIVVFFGGLQASDRYQKESYACWFLSLHFESCCIQKPHIFQPFSLFTIEALPRNSSDQTPSTVWSGMSESRSSPNSQVNDSLFGSHLPSGLADSTPVAHKLHF